MTMVEQTHAPWTDSGSNTPDRTIAKAPTAMTATPMRTAMVRLGVMADETIGNSLNFGQNSVNTTATKGALHRPSRQGASVIIHNISPTSGKGGP